ncbi:RloB family protein [Mycobacterium riyadhense]|nr:RloB family protein [Mycobacterium riyadhense]MCV7146688.1 RloB domain-containing protein [Mycobacterium riyadhense]
MSGNRSRRTRRTANSQAPSLRIRIHAEGQNTEVAYVNYWRKKFRFRTIVTIAEHQYSSPMDLVRLAASDRRTDMRAAKRFGDPYDEYWCVFDVDEHANLSDALEMARANEVKIALSNPCLEQWFLLHFREQTAHLDRRQAQKLAYEYLSCGKSMTDAAQALLDARYEDAKNRARHLITRHLQNGTPFPANPSSNMFELMETIAKGGSVPGSGLPKIPPMTSSVLTDHMPSPRLAK